MTDLKSIDSSTVGEREVIKALASLAGNSTRLDAISRQARIPVERLRRAAAGQLQLRNDELRALKPLLIGSR